MKKTICVMASLIVAIMALAGCNNASGQTKPSDYTMSHTTTTVAESGSHPVQHLGTDDKSTPEGTEKTSSISATEQTSPRETTMMPASSLNPKTVDIPSEAQDLYCAEKGRVLIFSYDSSIYGLVDNGFSVKLENSSVVWSQYTPDRCGVYFVTGNDNELWFFNGQSFANIGSSYGDESVIALNGTIAWRTSQDEVFLYDGSNSALIAQGVTALVSISPDGKAVGYMRGERGYYWSESEHDLGENIHPFAFSNNAKLVYIKDAEDRYYVQIGPDSSQVSVLGKNIITLVLNSDGTQMLFNTDNGCYLSMNGKVAEQIYTIPLNPIARTSRAHARNINVNFWYLGVKSFTEQFFVDKMDDYGFVNLYWLTESGELVRKAEGIQEMAFHASNDHTVFFAEGKDRTYILDADKDVKEKWPIPGDSYSDDEEYSLLMPNLRSMTALTTKDGTLFFVGNDGKPKKLTFLEPTRTVEHNGFSIRDLIRGDSGNILALPFQEGFLISFEDMAIYVDEQQERVFYYKDNYLGLFPFNIWLGDRDYDHLLYCSSPSCGAIMLGKGADFYYPYQILSDDLSLQTVMGIPENTKAESDPHEELLPSDTAQTDHTEETTSAAHPALPDIEWTVENLEFTNPNGYIYGIEVKMSPWMLLSANKELLQKAWDEIQTKDKYKTLPGFEDWGLSAKGGGVYHAEYRDASSALGSKAYFNEDMDDMYYCLGTISFKNLTDGWDFTSEKPGGIPVNILLYKARNYIPSIGKVFSSSEVRTYINGIVVQPVMERNTWGPMAFIIMCPEKYTPNAPDGQYGEKLAEKTITIGIPPYEPSREIVLNVIGKNGRIDAK